MVFKIRGLKLSIIKGVKQNMVFSHKVEKCMREHGCQRINTKSVLILSLKYLIYHKSCTAIWEEKQHMII